MPELRGSYAQNNVHSSLFRNQQVAGSNPIAGSSIFKGFRVLPLRPFFHLVGKLGQIPAVLLAKYRQFGGWGSG